MSPARIPLANTRNLEESTTALTGYQREQKSDRIINYFYLNETRFRRRFHPPSPPPQPPPTVFYFSVDGDAPPLTFSSTPEASVVRRPRKMVARSGTSLIFHFVAYRYRGAAPRRGGAPQGIVTPSKRAYKAGEKVESEKGRGPWKRREDKYSAPVQPRGSATEP